jgi:hypothetical protein
MKSEKSLIYRVGAGKAMGLVIGLLGFFILPTLVQEPSMLLRTGIFLWYPTLGAMIGMFGVFSYHPVLNFPMPWWLRGALIGGWMNFLLTLFAYDQISTVMMAIFGHYSQQLSPFIMVLEGAVIGMVMDYFLTRWFGEGWSDKPNN